MKIRLILLFVLGAAMVQVAQAQAPKFSNDFLNIGIGARAQAMSSSVVASVSDVTASYWNPAALSTVNAPFQVGAMHAEWFAGIGKYDYLSIGKSFNEETDAFGGISLIRMAIDQIPNTLRLRDADGNINYDAIEEFSVADYAFLVSYGQRIKGTVWRVGGNVKVIHRSIGSFAQAWGFGLDAGIQAKWDHWRFGASFRDITSTFNAWTFSFSDEEKQVLTQTNNDIPESSIESTLPTANIGVGYFTQLGSKFSLLAETNLILSTNGTESAIIGGDRFVLDPNIGVEFGYKDYLFLRAGMGNVQEVINDFDGLSTEIQFQPTAGLGIRLGRLTIDYAFTNIGELSDISSSHIFSLTLDFVKRSNSSEI